VRAAQEFGEALFLERHRHLYECIRS
jgi:hypothetical protein